MATIAEVIAQVDELKPNQFSHAQKVMWISECESMVYAEVICQHVRSGNKCIEYTGYTEDTDPDTLLMATHPYDNIYRYYLLAQIDLANQEYIRYNNSSALFNAIYQAYRAWYTRNNMPAAAADHFTI